MKNLIPINILFCLIASLLMISSCNDKKEAISEKTAVQIKSISIENYQDIDVGIKSASLNGIADSKTTIDNYKEFDVINSIQVQEPYEDTSKISKKIRNKIAATGLSDTVRYRLLFFDINNNNQVVVDELIKVGEFPEIFLDTGIPYKWVAYSINESTVPDISSNVINRNVLCNKDLLYVSGNITLVFGTNFIDLTFKRYTTQYVVNLDVRGMFATLKDNSKIKLSKNNGDLFKTANFNILNGEFVANTDSTITLDATTMSAIIPNELDKKTAKFYSVATAVANTSNELKLNFEPLSIVLDDGYNRVFTNATVNLKHNALSGSSTRGKRYTINTMLVESAIKVGTSTTEWARSNLWYDADNTKGKYRFRVSPFFRDLSSIMTTTPQLTGILTDVNDLWKYGIATPTGETGGAFVDPCSKVYPEGLWIMPTTNQYSNLPSRPTNAYVIYRNEPSFYGLLGLIGRNQFFEIGLMWQSSSTTTAAYSNLYDSEQPASHSNNLYLLGIGYKDISNIIVDRPTSGSLLSIGSVVGVISGLGGAAYYWALDGTTPSTASYFKVNLNYGSAVNINVGFAKVKLISGSGTISTWELPAFDRDNKLNIRCVRNQSFVK